LGGALRRRFSKARSSEDVAPARTTTVSARAIASPGVVKNIPASRRTSRARESSCPRRVMIPRVRRARRTTARTAATSQPRPAKTVCRLRRRCVAAVVTALSAAQDFPSIQALANWPCPDGTIAHHPWFRRVVSAVSPALIIGHILDRRSAGRHWVFPRARRPLCRVARRPPPRSCGRARSPCR